MGLSTVTSRATIICNNIFSKDCKWCNSTMCTECERLSCGRECRKGCHGRCSWDCDIDTCLCDACEDGFYALNCSVPCSNTCFAGEGNTPTCYRYTGGCKDGCKEGYCSETSQCKRKCSSNCDSCDIDCLCLKCKGGFYGESCDPCPSDCLRCDQKTGACEDGKQTKDTSGTEHTLNCDQCLNNRCKEKTYCLDGCKPNTECRKSWTDCSNSTGYCYELSPVVMWSYVSLYIIFWITGSYGTYQLVQKGIRSQKKCQHQGAELGSLIENFIKNVQRYAQAGYFFIDDYGVSREPRQYLINEKALACPVTHHWDKVTEERSQLMVLLSSNPQEFSDFVEQLRSGHHTPNVEVTYVTEASEFRDNPSCQLLKFLMQKNNEEMTIHLYYYFQWGEEKSRFMSFLHQVRNDPNFKTSSPTTVISNENDRPAILFAALNYLLDNYDASKHTPNMKDCVQLLFMQERELFNNMAEQQRNYFTQLIPSEDRSQGLNTKHTVACLFVSLVYIAAFMLSCAAIHDMSVSSC